MNVPYKNLRPSIFEKLDGLVAAGRTMPAACAELRSMIRDGAVTLLDLHDPGKTDDWLRQGAFTLIEAIRQNSKTLASDWQYFKNVDVIDWAEIGKAADAAISSISEKEPTTPASPTGIQTNKEVEAKAKCITWLRAMPAQPARRKPDVMAEAMGLFPKLSGRQFNAAWDEGAPAAWKKPGPKRSEHQ